MAQPAGHAQARGPPCATTGRQGPGPPPARWQARTRDGRDRQRPGADLYLDPGAFRETFAADVDPERAAVMAATQLILGAVEATSRAESDT
jgi:hypothetical protein